MVLAADTDVVLDGVVQGKPRDAHDAQGMLQRLSGFTHTVYSGLCVLTGVEWGGNAHTCMHYGQLDGVHIWFDLVASSVTMQLLDESAIAAYIATGEPLDKAGAYGIQGIGDTLVEQVQGSYTAVVGLPLPATAQLLTAAGIDVIQDASTAYYHWLREQGKEPRPCPPTLP